MSPTHHYPFGVQRWTQYWVVSVLLLLGLMASARAQNANVPTANQSISNIATATYRDADSQVLSVQSNSTSTVVLQVGAYTLTPSASSVTKAGNRDSTVYFPHTLTNTGNGRDTFNISVTTAALADFARVAVFLDDGRGLPSSTTPLCALPTTSGSSPTCNFDQALDQGQSVAFVVAYTLPANADNTWNQKTGTVKAKPKDTTTSWFQSYSQYNSQSNTEAAESRSNVVKYSDQAIFSVTKTLSVPAFTQPGSGAAWPNITSGPRPAAGQLGAETTYTLTYQNKGAAAGTLYIRDAIPSGLTYKAGSAVLSCAPNTRLTDTSGGDNTICDSAGIEYEYDGTGKTIHLRIPGVAANTTGTLSFIVQANDTAGTTANNTVNIASYTPGDIGGGGANTCANLSACITNPGSLDTTPPGPGTFEVTAQRKVRLNAADTTPGTPASTGDTITTAKVVPGVPGRQVHVIENTGDNSDTFNLTVTNSTGANAFPAGTTFVWKFADANNQPTGLATDSNADSIPDTGVIAAGSSRTMILEITLPAGTPVASAKNYEATALAKSVNFTQANNAQDASLVKVTDVVGGLVDLIGKDYASSPADVGVGPGPNQTPDATTPTVAAGSAVHQILLSVLNNETSANSYAVTLSTNSAMNGGLPTGWSYKVSSTICSNPTDITNNTIGSVSAGTNQQFYVCVYSPSTSPTVNQPVYIRVTGTATPPPGQSNPTDTIYYQISVVAANAYSFILESRGDRAAEPGQSAIFTYNLINNGTNTCGVAPAALKLTISLSSAMITAGWSFSVFKDATTGNVGNLDAADTPVTMNVVSSGVWEATLAQGLAASQSLGFFVKLNVPAGAQKGTEESFSLKVADVNANGVTQTPPLGCGEQGFSNKAEVSSGVVALETYQIATTAACSGQTLPADSDAGWTKATKSVKPGHCIFYKVVATATSASPVTDLLISSQPSTYTTVVTTPSATCVGVNLETGVVAPVTSGTQVLCGAGAGGSNTTTNKLNSTGTVTLKYATSVNQ